MSIVFRVVGDAIPVSAAAAITPAQVAAFRRFATENALAFDALVVDEPEFLGWASTPTCSASPSRRSASCSITIRS